MDELERIERQKYAKGVLLRANVKYPSYPWSGSNEANSAENLKKTPYFWWYSFLKLNDDYRDTCANGGVGKCAQLYKDLGNLYEMSFDQFWSAKQHLFVDVAQDWARNFRQIGTDGFEDSADEQELLADEHIEIVDPDAIEPIFDNSYTYLSVPVHVSKSRLIKEFSAILDQIKPTPQKALKQTSSVKYKLSRGYNVETLQRTYETFLLKQKEPSLKKYEIAERIGMDLKNYGQDGLGKVSVAEQRRLVTIMVCRYEEYAQRYIRAAATLLFPSDKLAKDNNPQKTTSTPSKKRAKK